MAQGYLSKRQKNLKIGIVSYTENDTVLEVIGKVGIGTTNPTSRLSVVGNVLVSGVVTASSFSGNASSATYATNSGITTNLKDGLTGNIPYQSGPNTTTFLTNGSSGTILQSNGVGNAPSWVVAAPADAITGLTIRDEGTIIGTANSVSQLNFVGNIVSATSSAGIATITFLDYVSNSGIATYATTSGVSTSVIGGIGSITQLSVSGVITAVTGNFSGIITSSGAIISGVSTVNGKIAAGNGIGNTNLSNTLNYNSSSGITAFRPISLVDSAAGIKISRNGGQTLGAAIELQTWDVGIVTNYSYWDVNAQSGYFGIRDIKNSRSRIFIDDSGSILLGATSSNFTTNYNQLVGVGTDKTLNVLGKAYISDNVGIGTTNATSKLTVQGDVLVSGVVTATTFVGALTGIAASATQLVTPRTFEITGDVVASAISFDGSGNVSLAATIQPNSVGLGTDTTGDYVRDITGTSNQITVTSGTGEGSTPTLSIPNQFTIPQDATVTRDLQVNRNLNVNGNITIGGTSATLFTTELKISDPDIVLGFRTDGSGNDISNDNTANHGGVALASTEGTPLVNLFIAGIETNPATYKKIMWFKSGTFTGLNTDAWLSNYAIGIGSTQFPTGTRLAAGSVQFTENDLAVVRNINASGVGTITSLSGTTATYGTGNFTTGNIVTGVVTTLSGTNLNYTGVGTVTNLTSTNATLTNINSSGISTLGITTFTGAVSFGSSAVFGDNDRLNFGDGNDLQIYHNGSDSIIEDSGSGNLYLQSNAAGIILQKTSGNENLARFLTDGAAELYFDNVKEFETTGYGATVFGTLQSQGLQINSGVSTLGITTATNLTARNINNSGITTTNSLNIGATQVISSARQLQNIASLDATTTATIEAAVSNAPNTFSDLQVTGISTFTNGPVLIGSATSTGTASQRLQVTGGAYVSGSVGIGTTNPQKSLHIAGVGTQSGGIRLGDLDFFAFGTDTNSGSPTFRNSQTNGSTTLRVLPNGTGNAQFEFFGTDYFQNTNAWDNVRIVSSTTEFRIDSSYAPAGIAKPIRIETNVSGGGGVFNNPYQLYLDTNGNVGIGTSVTFAKFNVQGNTYVSGSVGIGTTNPQSRLDVRGTISIGRTDVSGINSIRSVTDINSWEYYGVFKSVGTEDTSPQDIFFKSDGTKMFILGSTGDDVNEYSLSTPWEVNTAGFTTNFSIASQEISPLGLYFSSDGLNMYVCGNTGVAPLVASGDYVHQYSLGTAWDISNVGLATVGYTTSYNVTQDTAPQGVYLKDDDGTKMYIVGSTNDRIYEYSLSTPWNVSTAGLTTSILIGAGTTQNLPLTLTTPAGIDFNASGTKMYIMDQTRDVVARFDLPTAWDISTAIFYDNVYIGFQELTPTGIFYEESASRAYVIGSSGDTVYQYNIDAPSLELASSGISTRSSVILNNEARLNNRLYVTGDTHISSNTTLKGTLQVDSTATVSSTLTASAAVTFDTTTSNINLATSQTTGTLILGGITQTGAITLGRATTSQTTNIQAGVTASGNTKTINFGTGGASGSNTLVTVGSATAGAASTVTIPSPTNLLIGAATSTGTASQPLQVTGGAYVSGSVGIGTTNPTSKLHVIGDALITGISTLGTVRVSSGIITATSGIVTYYGDGSNLTGIGTISISSTPPSSPSAGRLWYNSDLGRTFIYYNDGDSSQWVDAAPFNFSGISTSFYTETSFIATSGQTTFNVTYDIGYVQVYLNGIRLTSSEYAATTGTSIVLNEAAALGDIIDVLNVATNIGPQGIQGPAGATTLAGVGTTSGSTVHYPVFIAGLGSSESYISTTSNYFSFIPSSGTLSVNQLNIPGISTFSGGPVLIGGGTSTGTASQRLQVTGGAYVSGNLGIGTANPNILLEVYTENTNANNVNSLVYEGSGAWMRIGDATTARTFTNGVGIKFHDQGNQHYSIGQIGGNFLIANTSSNGAQLFPNTTNTNGILLNSNNNVGINTTNPTSRLHVVGDAIITGVVTATDFNSTSDINLKTNIKSIDDPLEKIIQLNGVSFDWKHTNQSSAGVIAQDVEKVLPEIVRNDVDGYKSLNYNGLIGLLIEAVKEQNETIKSLEQKINTLEGRLG